MNKFIVRMTLAAFCVAVSYFFAGCGREDDAAPVDGEVTAKNASLIAEHSPSPASAVDSAAGAQSRGSAKREEIERRREERRAEREARREQRKKELGIDDSRIGEGGRSLTRRQSRRLEREKRRREEHEAARRRRDGREVPMTLEEHEQADKERHVQELAEREERERMGAAGGVAAPPADETPEQARMREAQERRELREAALEARREYEANLSEDELPGYRRKSLSYWIAKEKESRRRRDEAARSRQESDVSVIPREQETQRKE